MFCDSFFTWWIFYGEKLLAPHPNPQAGGPPLFGRPQLLIQYIRSYPPYLEAVPLFSTWGRAMPLWQRLASLGTRWQNIWTNKWHWMLQLPRPDLSVLSTSFHQLSTAVRIPRHVLLSGTVYNARLAWIMQHAGSSTMAWSHPSVCLCTFTPRYAGLRWMLPTSQGVYCTLHFCSLNGALHFSETLVTSTKPHGVLTQSTPWVFTAICVCA